MKRLIIIAALIIATIGAFSQAPDSTRKANEPYLLVIKGNRPGTGQKIYVGDRIIIILINRKEVRGRVKQISSQQIVMTGNNVIDFTNIRKIRRNKVRKEDAIVGGILAVLGTILLIPVVQGDVTFDAIPTQGGLGLGLIIGGLATIGSPHWYKLTKGDNLYYITSNH